MAKDKVAPAVMTIDLLVAVVGQSGGMSMTNLVRLAEEYNVVPDVAMFNNLVRAAADVSEAEVGTGTNMIFFVLSFLLLLCRC